MCPVRLATPLRCAVPVRFEGLESHGVGFERTAWLAAGDNCCKLVVRRLSKS